LTGAGDCDTIGQYFGKKWEFFIKENLMKKRITVMLLCACMSVSAYTGVQAADLSSGSSDSDVQIEMEEVDDSEDEADFTDAEDGLFSDGSDDTQTGDISAIANQIVAQARSQAQDYQEKKQAARKVIDAREVERRAQEIKEETTRIREEAQEAARKKAEEEARKAEQARVEHRENIAQFAVQFVGNPYVYGGTSLTNGADCSGFVMSVFKEFGYDLPRVAEAQYEASQKKDISQLETGDLVFYGAGGINHVALYIGNGKIVHASTAATGIKVSDYNYETPVGIGTYVE
jgi:cell wall-associated NlpC family hydrolase